MEGALQELDETGYWIELLAESGIIKREILQHLASETEQLISIMVVMTKKVKERSQ